MDPNVWPVMQIWHSLLKVWGINGGTKRNHGALMITYGKNILNNQHIGNGEDAARKLVKRIEFGF